MSRPETGPMRFGDDWTGVFIRGDNAGAYGMMLQEVLSSVKKGEKPDMLIAAQLEGLVDDLRGCVESKQLNSNGVNQCQIMKPFKECKAHE